MIRFLIDECLSPKLVEVANRFGYAAHHVQYRNWKSKQDNELHPGAVVIPNVPRVEQIAALEQGLRAIQAAEPPLDMVNTVVEVEESNEVRVYSLP